MFLFRFSIALFYYILFVESRLNLYYGAFTDNYAKYQKNLSSDDIKNQTLEEFNKAPFYENATNDYQSSTSYKFNFWEICRATFIKHHNNYVSILSVNDEFLNPKDVYKEFDLVEWHNNIKTFTVSNTGIIVLQSSGDLHQLLYIRSSIWNQESIFVIVILQCTEDVKIEMATLWQFYWIYKYVLVCGTRNPLSYIYRPFMPNDGSTIFKITDLSEIQHNILHGTDNLYGANMRVVFFPRVPTAVAKKGKYIGGPDYQALITLRDKMNFSTVIFRPTDGHTFTQAGKKVSGSARDIVNGNADLAFNGHFIQNYKIPAMQMTRDMYMDKICFIVGMPNFKSHFTVIIHIFSFSVWVHIVVMYYIIIILYYGIQNTIGKRNYIHPLQDLCIETFALIIFGASRLHTDLTSKKFLIGSALITALILNNTFQGSLVTVLSRPIRNRYINTLEDVMQSEVALQSQRAESLISDPEITELLNILRKRRVRKEANNFIRVGRFPIMKLMAYKNYLNYRENLTEYLHTVPECIMSNFLAYLVPHNSPFLGRINTYLLRFQEVGLNSKWFGAEMDDLLRDTYWPLENEQLIESKAKIFSMADVAFVFTLLLTGLIFSTVVFFTEKILGLFLLNK